MTHLGLIGFCFLAAFLTAAERFPYVVFAAASPPPHGSNAGLFEEQAGGLEETRDAGSNSLQNEVFPVPAAGAGAPSALRDHSNSGGAPDALLAEKEEEALLSTYERRAQKERQARRRLGKAALLLVLTLIMPFILSGYALWYSGEHDLREVLSDPDKGFSKLLPKGFHVVVFLALLIPSLLVPVAGVYTTISFYKWLYHFIMSLLPATKKAPAAGENSKPAETNGLAVASASPPSGSDLQ
ncbi:hypothetical protein ACSSS7_002584 [Eimeria intestinalis]